MAETYGRAVSNVYTVLLLIALVALLVGIAYVWWRYYELTGSFNPFDVASAAGEMLAAHGRAAVV